MAFTKIAAAGIGSTGTVILEDIRANSLVVSGVSTLGNVVATTGTFSGNVSIAGTLTYEDVTNIDSVGLITARSGVVVNTGTATTALIVNGSARITGILTIGTSSVTLDGTNNQVNVGTGVTIHHTNGVQVGGNTLHSSGLTVNSLNASGVVTATSFSGDGSNLTNTGSTLSAASGSQRVVLTGQTSGTMTASATSSALTFNASTGQLSATSFSGNGSALTGVVAATASALNSTGVSTISTLKFGYETTPIIYPTNSSYTIYISDSGNDTTGNGTSGNPYRSLQKAFDLIPRIIIRQAIDIRILGASYTAPSGSSLSAPTGTGWSSYYAGDGVTIRADTGTITFNRNDYGIEFYDVPYSIRFRNINFVIPNNANYNGLYFYNCDHIYMYDTCTWTTGCTYPWSYGGGLRAILCKNFSWHASVTVNSSSSPGLGGLFVFDRCNSVGWGGNISKSGTKWGQAALVAVNNTWIEQSGTINNFDAAIRLGINHYSAEDGAQCLLGNSQFTNCTYGVLAYHSSSLRAYYVTSTSGTTTPYSMNSGSHQH